MKTLSDQVVGTAHGKIILIGEHAVVYNEPAIAMPFMATPVEVIIEKINGGSVMSSSYYQGLLQTVPDSLNNLKSLIQSICSDLNQPVDGLSISISSLIPPERGMGSSAAVATALVRALFAYFERDIAHDTLLNYVEISEKIAHGNPSGLDARVTSSASPIYYKKNSHFSSIPLHVSGYLIAADTGMKGQTKKAVRDVAKQMERASHQTLTIIKKIGHLTEEARIAIQGDHVERLGELLTLSHECLKQINVSNERLDRLVDTALKNHALGAKLTGGGRGGCMIALARSAKQAKLIAHKLMENGAVETWIHALGENSNE